MAFTSRVNDAFNDIVAELETISTDNGYYTNPTVVEAIRPADKVTNAPEIGIEMGDEDMIPSDGIAGVFDSDVTVYIVGTAVATTSVDDAASELREATEQLRHDIKRIVAQMYYKYLPTSAGLVRWGVMGGAVRVVPVMGLGQKRDKAQVWARFRIKVWNQGSTTLIAGYGEKGPGEAGYGYF